MGGSPGRRGMAGNAISGRVLHCGEHFFDAVALAARVYQNQSGTLQLYYYQLCYSIHNLCICVLVRINLLTLALGA
jgi:hypothetical protein